MLKSHVFFQAVKYRAVLVTGYLDEVQFDLMVSFGGKSRHHNRVFLRRTKKKNHCNSYTVVGQFHCKQPLPHGGARETVRGSLSTINIIRNVFLSLWWIFQWINAFDSSGEHESLFKCSCNLVVMIYSIFNVLVRCWVTICISTTSGSCCHSVSVHYVSCYGNYIV